MAITDRKSAEAWLQGNPRDVQVAFATRCALRALPGIGTVDEATLGVLVLRVLRATLTSGVAAVRLTPEVVAAARFASADSAALSSAASLTLRSVESAALSSLTARSTSVGSSARSASARSTALSSAAFLTALSSVRSASADSAALSSVAAASLTARSSARSANAAATFSAADEDAQRYETDTPEFVFRLPLWYALEMPDGLEAALGKLREFWEADPETWGFWARWYAGMLEGKPLPWELQEQVALIPDADWQTGPAHVAGLIEEIEARFDLKARIRDLEGDLANASANRLGIGGNNPPEPIEDAKSISQDFIVIWEPVRELKAEVESEEPDSSKISSAISKLNALVAVCGKWTGGKLDAAATEYVKAIGKWGGGATTVWLAAQHPKVVSLMEAAERWLAALY